jgi:hypothetical protein
MANESTGTRDETFNLISVLYHALQGAETYQQYIQDAEQRGDQELVQFFRDVRAEEKRRAIGPSSCSPSTSESIRSARRPSMPHQRDSHARWYRQHVGSEEVCHPVGGARDIKKKAPCLHFRPGRQAIAPRADPAHDWPSVLPAGRRAIHPWRCGVRSGAAV